MRGALRSACQQQPAGRAGGAAAATTTPNLHRPLCRFFGERAELFSYKFVGRHRVESGFTSLVLASELAAVRAAPAERQNRKQAALADRSWLAFLQVRFRCLLEVAACWGGRLLPRGSHLLGCLAACVCCSPLRNVHPASVPAPTAPLCSAARARQQRRGPVADAHPALSVCGCVRAARGRGRGQQPVQQPVRGSAGRRTGRWYTGLSGLVPRSCSPCPPICRQSHRLCERGRLHAGRQQRQRWRPQGAVPVDGIRDAGRVNE